MRGSGTGSSVVAVLLSPQMPPENSHWLWKCDLGGGVLMGPWSIPSLCGLALAVWLQARSGWPVQPVGIGQPHLVPINHVPFPSWGSHPPEAGYKWD